MPSRFPCASSQLAPATLLNSNAEIRMKGICEAKEVKTLTIAILKSYSSTRKTSVSRLGPVFSLSFVGSDVWSAFVSCWTAGTRLHEFLHQMPAHLLHLLLPSPLFLNHSRFLSPLSVTNWHFVAYWCWEVEKLCRLQDEIGLSGDPERLVAKSEAGDSPEWRKTLMISQSIPAAPSSIAPMTPDSLLPY